tara:strand:+ start:371 stop:619 length:249 start_codon:yes stop_codon:yes gene_type:complete
MSADSQEIIVSLSKLPIELCSLLKIEGLAISGGEAKHFISQGLVKLNGELETQKRKKIVAGDRVEYAGNILVVKSTDSTNES